MLFTIQDVTEIWYILIYTGDETGLKFKEKRKKQIALRIGIYKMILNTITF